jgi:ferrochelatase
VTENTGKTAVVLFNMGGPDSLDGVRPFLFNLFNDPAIIGAPGPVRWLLARFISWRRAPVARKIYRQIGGASPLLANTRAQLNALEAVLAKSGSTKCFLAMRYSRPMADEAAQAVKRFAPDRIVLLPLYPQFSTTTTGSSMDDWARAAARAGLEAETRAVCCYPEEPGFISAVAGLVEAGWRKASEAGTPRILFSAHGLPKKTITGGDPYQCQVERTAAAVAAVLGDRLGETPDWRVCYQSRVGPLEWIGPHTDAEIVHAGGDGVPLVIAPIAFVSEHSETLVELDIEYRALAEKHNVPAYIRVSTVGVQEQYIDGLAGLVHGAARQAGPVAGGGWQCPGDRTRCRRTA